MGDSAEYLTEAALEQCECPCGGDSFEITAAVSIYEESDDVRWLYLGCRCPACGLTAVYGDGKNEFNGYQELLPGCEALSDDVQFVFDAWREVKHEVAPGNVLLRAGDTKYAYDKRGRRLRKVDLTDHKTPQATEYTWDARDLLRAATLADGTRVSMIYDALGRRVRRTLLPGGRSRVSSITFGTATSWEFSRFGRRAARISFTARGRWRRFSCKSAARSSPTSSIRSAQ